MTRLWPEGEPVEAWGAAAGAGRPDGFRWQGTDHPIEEVCNRWRVHTRWWEPGRAVWREYVKVATAGGLLCLLYRDLASGGWFLARVYD